MIKIGCCITPHGFGHAARACAVMEALAARMSVCFEIVSTTPEWFFAESLTATYRLHPVISDIGLVQRNSLQEDPELTLGLLNDFYPLEPFFVNHVAALFADCQLVICDIAPLGIVAAEKCGVESVLLENFTWDWIYQGYVDQWPGFSSHIDYLQQLYATADYHIQAEPVCNLTENDPLTPPIARQRRQQRSEIRQQLRIDDSDSVVLVTMGGAVGTELPIAQMAAMEGQCCFVLSGQDVTKMVVQGNLRLLPQESSIYHPDLVAACDAVIGKVGYSTLAEVYQAGIPFGYICRPGFRESTPLASFIDREMVSLEITEEQFRDNTWLDLLPQLCALAPDNNKRANGVLAAADFLADLLDRQLHDFFGG